MDNTGRLAWGLTRGKLSSRDTWHQAPPTLGCRVWVTLRRPGMQGPS